MENDCSVLPVELDDLESISSCLFICILLIALLLSFACFNLLIQWILYPAAFILNHYADFYSNSVDCMS